MATYARRELGIFIVPHSDMTAVALSGLRVGVRLESAIYDATPGSDLLLLSGGTTITRSLLDRLEQRGISQVLVSSLEVARLVAFSTDSGTSTSRLKDYQRDQSLKAAFDRAEQQSSNRGHDNHLRADSFFHQVQRPAKKSFSAEAVEQVTQQQQKAGRRVDALYDRFEDGDVSNAFDMSSLTSESLLRISEDIDLFLSTGVHPNKEQKYPSRHALQTASLSMAIGTIHGLKRDDLIELGMGCLLHDIGMMHMDTPVHQSSEILDKLSYLEITKHPIRSMDLLRNAPRIPSPAKMVAYQMHERFDGSGYPRGRAGNQIHLFARIAAVADVYVALVSPRPHRAGQLPYHAVEQILYDTRARKFDPNVVRSFLHTVSLFPVGSYVELTDGRCGRILRSNRERYTQPLIEVVSGDPMISPEETLDLSKDDGIRIARPLSNIVVPERELVVA